jgi:hypothetical protein
MGKMGFGYGSEWQLLRMMGRHRTYYDTLVKEAYHNKKKDAHSDQQLFWYDFRFNGSKDKELLGEDIFREVNLDGQHPKVLERANWDCVGKIDGFLLLGEAKGYIDELCKANKSDAKEVSRKEYVTVLKEVFKEYKIEETHESTWLDQSFQLGNRIAMQLYLQNRGTPNYILYIMFLNDWKFEYLSGIHDSKLSVENKERWMESFDGELRKLGFDEENMVKVKKNIMFIFPDCDQ